MGEAECYLTGLLEKVLSQWEIALAPAGNLTARTGTLPKVVVLSSSWLCES